MSFKVHTIQRYNYSFDARSGGPGQLQLWGDNGKKLADIRFVADDAAVPAPTLYPGLTGANAYFKMSALLPLIDMLRHENPVKLTVNDQSPGFVFIHTDVEPVGEEETA